jgi:hypothetical protein
MGIAFTDQLKVTRVGAALSATDTTDAALSVLGGVAIQKNLEVGTTLGVAGTATFNSTTASSSTSTGAVVVAGGVGIAGKVNINDDTYISSSTASTSTTTGALKVAGGVGIAGGLNATGLSIIGSTRFITNDASISGLSLATWDSTFVVVGKTGDTGGLGIGYSTTSTGGGAEATIVSAQPGTAYKKLRLLGSEVYLNGVTSSSIQIFNSECVRVDSATTAIKQTTSSSSSTTGALTVAGGVGIAGGLNVAGSIGISGSADISGTANVTGALNVTGSSTINTLYTSSVNSATAQNVSISASGSSDTILIHPANVVGTYINFVSLGSFTYVHGVSINGGSSDSYTWTASDIVLRRYFYRTCASILSTDTLPSFSDVNSLFKSLTGRTSGSFMWDITIVNNSSGFLGFSRSSNTLCNLYYPGSIARIGSTGKLSVYLVVDGYLDYIIVTNP